MSNEFKTVILVVGMHRSGTSALTGLLDRFGIDVPLAPGTKIGDDNPRGHWEHTGINRINDEILRGAGLTWTAWEPVEPEKISATHRERLKGLVEAETGRSQSNFVAFKDPRICVLLPTWKRVIAELGYQLCVVFCMRHPMAVARSIKKRNGLCIERGLLLWLHYNLEALCNIGDTPAVYVSFPAWTKSLNRLHRSLEGGVGRQLPRSWQASESDAAGFVTSDLVHQQSDSSGMGDLQEYCLKLHSLMVEGQPPATSDIAQQADELRSKLGPIMRISSRVVLDERQIWRERINDMHALINRNS